jgi:hypothetical protein
MKPDLRILIVAAAMAVSVPLAMAQTTPAIPTAPQLDYHPSLGDLMTMAVQPRHIKLWLAGKEKNWIYAAYELSELKGSLARVGRTIPQYRNMNISELVAASTEQPIAALDAAIRAKDGSAFIKAYGALTEGCNSCHQSGEHPMVVVKVPEGKAFPDQDFRPPAH